MAEINTAYVTARAATEASGTPRTVKAVVEAVLNANLPGNLVIGCTIQNQSGNDMKIASDAAMVNYILIGAGITRQLVLNGRLDVSQVYTNVNTNNDPFTVELIYE